MTIEVVDWVFEERVKRYLVKWMGGENLTTAAKVITEMAKEAADTAYEEGYRFAKEEAVLLEKATKVLDDE
jgi:hypothetical protein